ncbi:MAG: carbohydrate ABC transporter permease [Anaerolineae bacterium]|nr:carbohydrate ABC transporter permease [Anaerolineae bacterium]
MKKRSRRSSIFLYSMLILWAFICLFPFYWMITTSFKMPLAVNRGPVYIPFIGPIDDKTPPVVNGIYFKPTIDHWKFLLVDEQAKTVRYFRNSLIAAGVSCFFAVLIGSMAGYGLSRFRYYWARLGWRNDNIAFWIISQRFLPPAAVVIPFLLFFNTLRLIDTHTGLILAYTVFNLPFAVWIMRDFFDSLPIDLEESARVDGATRWQTFLRIVIPLSTPGLVTVALFSFIFAWNEYLFALMLTNFEAITMPVYLAGMKSTKGIEWWYMSALTLIMVTPVMLIGLFLQRYIVRGLAAGALKG